MTDLAGDILELVAIPSVTGDEHALGDHLGRRILRSRFAGAHELVRIGDSLIVAPSGRRAGVRPTGRPLVVLAGHIDTVPLGECGPPWRDGAKVHGRGAADIKAGLAVMLRLLEELDPATGFSDRAFVFYTGEEGPADRNALPSLLEAEPWLARASLAILCEPTSGDLELGCQGSIHFEVTLRGTACHSARPWLGRHALRDALPWHHRLFEHSVREVDWGGVRFRELVSVTMVHAGDARNVIPGAATVNVNLRYAPDRSPEDAEALALSLAPEPEVGTGRLVDHAPAGQIPLGDRYFAHLLASVARPRRAKQAWTDVARFSAVGVPAVNWGPGDPALAHVRDEWVDGEEAGRCYQDLASYLGGVGPDA